MNVLAYVVLALVAATGLILLLVTVTKGIRAYIKYRGQRLIYCPENRKPAAVEVNALHASLSNATDVLHLELRTCSRWPEKQGCGQECLSQIERSPEECLVRTIVTQWYAGKVCATCGRPIQEVEWLGHKPALLDSEGKTVYWDKIRAESLPEVFKTHLPVCWDCHIATTLLREHPEVVTHRPMPPRT
jgi:hypothetical protein